MTFLVLVGQMSQWYKCPTCPQGANVNPDLILDACGALFVCSLFFLVMSL